VLVLDALEKSSFEVEYTTLDGFLSHLDDWPSCHIFLGLRPKDPAWKKVNELNDASPEAEIYELPPMNLEDSGTRYLFVESLRDQLTNLKTVTDAQLLQLVNGFPGVVSRWLSASNRSKMTSFSDLRMVADEAQRYKYFEFDQLLPPCSTNERKLAVRLALFPNLDSEDWTTYKDIILEGIDDELLPALQDKKVLEEDYGYGHETRHAAARRWFLEHLRAQTEYEASALMFRLACCVWTVSSR
jgi:hypothetical protein